MKEYNNVFNTYQKINSKLEDYKQSDIKVVQVSTIGISPIIYEEPLNNNMIRDAINVFSSFEAEKVKRLIIRKK